MNDPAFPQRRDMAVIMARGLGARMGQDKGSLRLREGGPTFLEMVDGLYRQLGISRLVVTLPHLIDRYQTMVDPVGGPLWLAEGEGGDTGRTVGAAWRNITESAGEHLPPTHLWIHPVDMPLVKNSTIQQLKQISETCPEDIIRPAYKGAPGHPVVTPLELLDRIFATRDIKNLNLPMRNLLDQQGMPGHIQLEQVSDPGAIRDFDTPQDLTPGEN